MTRRFASLIVRLLGAPPPRTASLPVRRRYTRRVYMRILPAQIVVYGLLVILGAPIWLLIVLGVGAVASLCGFALVNLQIWREGR